MNTDDDVTKAEDVPTKLEVSRVNFLWIAVYLVILVATALFDFRITALLLTLSIIYWFTRGEKAFGKPVHNWLVKYDWVWLAPVGIFAFVGIGYLFQNVFNLAIGTYDLSFLQPVFLSLVVTTLVFSGATLFLRLNWGSLFKYWMADDDIEPDAEINMFADIKSLSGWQRLLFLFSLLFSYVLVTLLVYRALV